LKKIQNIFKKYLFFNLLIITFTFKQILLFYYRYYLNNNNYFVLWETLQLLFEIFFSNGEITPITAFPQKNGKL